MSQTSQKITLGVFFGGESSEYEISCLSAAGVLDNIDSARYHIIPVGITREGAWFVYDGDSNALRDGSWETDTAHLTPAILSPCKKHHGLLLLDKQNGTFRVQTLDCIFPVMHGENCEDGRLQGLLSLSGVPFVGCETRASSLTMDKAATKLILERYGVAQAEWVLLYRGEIEPDASAAIDRVEQALSYPVFVKPAGTGSSKGVSCANDRTALASALRIAASFDEKILVERAVSGKEVEVALLERFTDGKKELLVSCVGEIQADGSFYDYDAKYIKGTSICRIPAELSPEISEKIRAEAARIFRALDCRSLSRADFFVEGDKVIFNEINSLPGFTSISMFPKLFSHEGISYSALIDTLIAFATEGACL